MKIDDKQLDRIYSTVFDEAIDHYFAQKEPPETRTVNQWTTLLGQINLSDREKYPNAETAWINANCKLAKALK